VNDLKKVALVGRMNVGKSTLFNCLSTDVKSLTLDYEGVTRDFIKDVVSWQGVNFELIDTGGISFKKSQDVIQEAVRQIALNSVQESDIVLFVCDASVGILPQDQEIAKFLRKHNKNVILVVNKIDTKAAQINLPEFYKFGFDKNIFVSAQHSKGIGDLLELIVQELKKLPQRELKEDEPGFTVVLLGKPNVGKSSLLNLLLKRDRAIVADVPGTTREALQESVKFYKEHIQLIDTAGLRKKRSVTEDIEELMVKSTFHAVKNADIVLLLTDASEGRLLDQELKLAFYVFEQGKALVMLFNKQDLVDEEIKEQFDFETSRYEFFLKKLELLNISCKTGKNVGKVFSLVDEVWKRYSQKFSDIELTELFKSALDRTPLYRNQNELLVKSVKQVKTAPITLVLYVNLPQYFEGSQLAFFDNLMRSKYNLKSVPIMFMVRKA
jgi:GTPase